MLTRRLLLQNVPRLTKFCDGYQGTRFERVIFAHQCLLAGRCAMNIHSRSTAREILQDKKEYRLSCLPFQLSSNRKVFTRSKKEVSLRVKDKIPSGYFLIYKAPMDNYVKYGQLCSSIGIVFTAALSLNELYYLSLSRIDVSNTSITQVEFITFCVGLASIVTFLHLFLSRFTVRMYHNPSNDAYIAVFFNPIGLTTKLDFKKGELKQLKSRLPLPWKKNLFSINGRTAMLNEIHFRLPADYNTLLDFDKVS